MRRARKTGPLVVGFAVAAIYLIGAFTSGRIDLFARRPLLESNFLPPPYRWVSPPPEFATNNLKPDATQKKVAFDKGVSDGEFVTTNDGQASVVLPKGAVPPKPGVTGTTFSIDPRDPAKFRGYPKGTSVRGNVYEIRAKYVGGGDGVLSLLDPPGRIILVYPARLGAFFHATHSVAFSTDGTSWKVLPTDNDSPVALQIAVSSSELGYFAVVAKPTAAPKAPKSATPIILISAVVVVAGASGIYARRMAQIRAENRKKRVPRELPKSGRGPRRR